MDEEKHTYLKLNNISPLINSDNELKRLKEELERVKEELKTKTEKCHQYENNMVNISVMDRWNEKGLGSASDKEGMGITIMKHRAKEIGAYFDINTAEDESFSTCVACIIPLEIIIKE